MVITANVRAGEALERLLAGNRRHVTAMHIHPDQTPARRQELVAGQTPFAAILSCSDSRVVPEIIFDQGLGHLFVVRVAGNIVDGATLGSLEYAVRHLGVPLVLVMGHSGCGAVTAAVEGGDDEGQIRTLVAAIQPAVVLARNEPGPLVDNAVRANVRLAVRRLQDAAPVLAPRVTLGQVMIAGGVYDLRTGAVDLLDLRE
ncbi:MAG TPA: carbonic anhydrase [Anaerolineae bacterium]